MAGGIALGLAGFLYQPWRRVPFDIVDYSEFLPLLLQHHTMAGRLGAFTEYYGSQGRLNLLSYLLLIGKWMGFGWNTVGWQVARFAQMAGVVAGVYFLLRRLTAGRWGPAAGAALFITAGTAAPAWIRLTMGEPLGLVFLLGAAGIAVQYQTTRRWRLSGVMIGLLVAAALLTKEMLVGAAPFLLLLAWCFVAPGRLAMPRRSERNVWVLATTAAAGAAVLVPVAMVGLNVSSDAYSAQYGAASMSIGRLIDLLTRMVLPARASYAPYLRPLLLPANVIFLGIVLVGWRVGLREPATRAHRMALGAIALSLPVVGAVLYLPWPQFNDFYGLPFLLGPALLLAMAVSFIENGMPRGRWIMYAGCLGLLATTAAFAQYAARAAMARREVNREVVTAIVERPGLDSVVVAMPYLTTQRWQGTGPTLGRYAAALSPGVAVPSVSDALCRETLPLFQRGGGRAMLVSYADGCGSFPRPTSSTRRYFTYIYWPTLSLRVDSVRVDLLTASGGR